MLKILGRTTSINVRKVLWSCAEMRLDVEQEDWGAGDLDLRRPDFLVLNPHGLIPVLVDGDVVLWESNTICRYLATRERREDLLPTRPADRARVEQWMDWQGAGLNFAWVYAFLALVRKAPGYDDPEAIARSIAAWNRQMTILDAQLAATGAYVTGPTFTLADIVIGLAAYRWTMTPIERPSLPAVAAWMARLDEREPYRRWGGNGVP